MNGEKKGNENRTILIVDDNKLQVRMLEIFIAPLGYKTEKVYGGEDALFKIYKNQPDLILLDVMMPNIDGYELCKALKSSDLTRFIPIIIISAQTELKANLKAIEMGANDFLIKPFNDLLLAAKIKSLMKVKSLTDQIQKHSIVLEKNIEKRTRELEQAQYVTVFSLAKLAECRDPETGEHLERIMLYSKIITKELSTTEKYKYIIEDRYIEMINMSSSLHDIGKVGIPDRILLKPGKLTSEEFEIMKTHSKIGGEALAAAEEKIKGESFLGIAKEIAYYHHEKFDGSGYPAGLIGEKIPLSARIMALADVYDAMTSKRVYKDKISPEETKKVIISESGKHFDPDIIEAFLNVTKKFDIIWKRYIE